MKKSIIIITIIILLVMITSTHTLFAEDDSYENIKLSVTTSRKVIPVGGNQNIEIKAQVMQGNQMPLEGIVVSFFARTNNNDRNEHLSVNEAVTDKNGIVTSNYTTLAEDDNEHLILTANARINDDYWIGKNVYPIASDDASQCEGRIINPFTGEPHSNTDISIFNMDTEYNFLFKDIVDERGFYSFYVQPGNYNIQFLLDLEEANYYTADYIGSHSRFKSDNVMEIIREMTIEKNQNYTIESEMGIIKGKVSNLDSNELRIQLEDRKDIIMTDINPDGSFMVALPAGFYQIADRANILKSNIAVKKGEVTDLGSFEKVVYENLSLSVIANNNVLPTGGGQTSEIIARVLYGEKLPAGGTVVNFFAQTRDEEKTAQLSTTEAVTDENGIASTSYTTLAKDDNKHITLTAVTQVDDDRWINKDTYLVASDQASWCEGRIINPFTGEPHSNTAISIFNMDTEYYFLFKDEVDQDGFYSFVLNPGNYHIRFHLDLGDANYYNNIYNGSHSLLKDDNTAELRIGKVIEDNKKYSLNSEIGIIKGKITNMNSNNELYITGKGGRDTVIANINPDGNFMILLQEGVYEISDRGGHIIESNIRIENGNVTD
ncbi:MAG: hypothetical protein ACQEQH_09060, partial [Bacillota bacterium]